MHCFNGIKVDSKKETKDLLHKTHPKIGVHCFNGMKEDFKKYAKGRYCIKPIQKWGALFHWNVSRRLMKWAILAKYVILNEHYFLI